MGNRDMLREVALALGDLRKTVVFVGGTNVSLLVSDPAAPEPRTSEDVDFVADIKTYADSVSFDRELRDLGFREDTREGAPRNRWIVRGVTVDVIYRESGVWGASNRWCPVALSETETHDLGSEVAIRVPTAPVFLVLKLEAFRSRGNGDYRESKDIEDFIAVVDGRPSITREAMQAPLQVAKYLRKRIRELLLAPSFCDAVAGHLRGDPASQMRVPEVMARLRHLAAGTA